MYREYRWQRVLLERDTIAGCTESIHGREILLADRECTDSIDNRAHSTLAATGALPCLSPDGYGQHDVIGTSVPVNRGEVGAA